MVTYWGPINYAPLSLEQHRSGSSREAHRILLQIQRNGGGSGGAAWLSIRHERYSQAHLAAMYDLQLFYRRSAPRPPIYDLLPVVLMRTVILNYHAIHATPVAAAWKERTIFIFCLVNCTNLSAYRRIDREGGGKTRAFVDLHSCTYGHCLTNKFGNCIYQVVQWTWFIVSCIVGLSAA